MKKTGNVVVLPLTLCLLGCSGEKNQEKPVEPVRVKVMEVNSSEAEVVHRFSGTIEEGTVLPSWVLSKGYTWDWGIV